MIAIDRPRFNLDAREIRKNKEVKLIVISRKIFYFIGKIFIDSEFQFQSSYHFKQRKDFDNWNETIGKIHGSKHQNIDDFENKYNILKTSKHNLFSYYEYIFRKYLIHFNIRSLLLSNVDYWETQEFSRVLKKNNIKITVLYRESVGSKKQIDYLSKFYSSSCFKDVSVDQIFVFGHSAKRIFENTNFIDKNKVTAVGLPRMDSYKDLSISKNKTIVTLFNFSLPSYKLEKTSIDVIKIINDVSKKYPEFHFWIKTKSKSETQFLKQLNIVNNNNNLKISHKFKMKDIIQDSKVIIGSNTTAVIETLFLDAYFIFPSWGIEDENEEYLIVNKEIDTNELLVSLSKSDFINRLDSKLKEKN